MNPLEGITPEDLFRIRDESLPDHIHILDDGVSIFTSCSRCKGFVGIYARREEQEKQTWAFIKEHIDCPGRPPWEEDEIEHVPPLTSEEKCPRMGLQGAVIKC